MPTKRAAILVNSGLVLAAVAAGLTAGWKYGVMFLWLVVVANIAADEMRGDEK